MIPQALDAESGPPSSEGTAILVGNAMCLPALAHRYDQHYVYCDAHYPGPGGYVVRTVHNPFGDGRNVIVLGESDAAGVAQAVERFLAELGPQGGGTMRGVLKLGLIAMCMVLSGYGIVYGQLADSPWPMRGHDARHTGQSPYLGTQMAAVVWTYQIEGSVFYSSPAIGSDGIVYVGSNKLYALNPDGTLKWAYRDEDYEYFYVSSSPAIGSDGTVYVGSNKLYALNPDGTLKWAYQTGSSVSSSPAIGSDGIVYVGSYDHKLYALHPDGTLKWAYQTEGEVSSSPAIGPDGTVYVGSGNNHKKVYALHPDGTLKWAYQTGKAVFSSPAIGPDGTVYVGSGDHKLYALHPDGTLMWTYATEGWVSSSPAIGPDGTIYVGSYDGKIYALYPEMRISRYGNLKWAYQTGGQVYSSPAIGSDGTVYVGSHDGKMYALNPDGTLKWAYEIGREISSSPAIGSDGTVYVGSHDGRVYAFGIPTFDLSVTPQQGVTVDPQMSVGLHFTIDPDSATISPSLLSVSGSVSGEVPFRIVFSGKAVMGIPEQVFSPGETVTVVLSAGEIRDLLGRSLPQDSYQWSFQVGAIHPWPMRGRDAGHTGQSPYPGAQRGLVVWAYQTGGPVSSSPVIGSDGTVYVGSDDGKLYALYPDGTLRWVYETGGYGSYSPAIGSDGTVYVGSNDDKLHALGPAGTLKWAYETGNSSFSSPVIGSDGTVYVASSKLYALHPDGTLRWVYRNENTYVSSSPAIGSDGTVYVGADKLYALHPDGTFRWAYRTFGNVLFSPAIGSDGTVYVRSDEVYALNPDGTLRWAYQIAGHETPAIGPDGTVYVGAHTKLYALRGSTGTLKWAYQTGGSVSSSPAIGSDGTIYVGSDKLYALNSDGTLKWTYEIGGTEYSYVSSSPAIGSDGTVYVGWSDGKLYAFKGPVVAIEENEAITVPKVYALSQNVPNPFNPNTTIPYALPQASVVRLVIYDMRGTWVRNLVNDSQEEGYHHVIWDGRDEGGRASASGIYVCRLEALGMFSAQRVVRTWKMVLLR